MDCPSGRTKRHFWSSLNSKRPFVRVSHWPTACGSTALRVEAIFDDVPRDPQDPLDELVDLGDGSLIVSREVTADGRSLARVNDRTVTVGALAAFGGRIAEIHGQHEHQRLFAAERQRALLDRFGGHMDLVVAVGETWRAWRAAAARAGELVMDPRELERRTELLRHQAREIEAAALQPDEDVSLAARVKSVQHLEAIVRSVGDAVRTLQHDGGALDGMRSALAQLESAAAHDERFTALLDEVVARRLDPASAATQILDDVTG